MMKELPIIEEVERLKSQKRYSEAQLAIEGAIVRYPNRYELYEELADIYIYQTKYLEARKALDYAQKINVHSSTGLYLRGYMELVDNNFSQAIEYLEESNTQNPNNPEVLRNLGWAYTMTGDVRKGVILLERALAIAPDDTLIMEDLGVALLTQGKIKEAREYLSKVGKESHMTDMGFSA